VGLFAAASLPAVLPKQEPSQAVTSKYIVHHLKRQANRTGVFVEGALLHRMRTGHKPAKLHTGASNKAPVLSKCICCSSCCDKVLPTLAKSMACPPAMPRLPAACARTCVALTTRLRLQGICANKSKASGCKASPANKAVASSYCTCTVGFPREACHHPCRANRHARVNRHAQVRLLRRSTIQRFIQRGSTAVGRTQPYPAA
jgi:hypothetical protein